MFEVLKTAEFDTWLVNLKDQLGKARIVSRIQRLEQGNPGDAAPVGDGISELRIHSGSGYRVYYKQTGRMIVLLLCGGDKSTQQRDINAPRTLPPNCEVRIMAKISKFDAAEYLDSPATIAAYLTEAFESNDPAFISLAIGTVARAKGMASVASEAGVSRESLYKSLSGTTKPEFDTVRKVLNAVGVKLVVEPIEDPAKAA